MRRLLSRTSVLAAAGVAAVVIAAVLIVASASSVQASRDAGPAGEQPLQATSTCRVQAANVVVRVGPGTMFPPVSMNPSALTLGQGAQVRAISFVRRGAPKGSWLEIQLGGGRPSGYIPAEETAVRCQPAATTLPQGRSPILISRVAVDGADGDDSDNPILRGPAEVRNGQYIVLPGASQDMIDRVLDQNGKIRFSNDSLALAVEVYDRETGQVDGNGIQEVQFQIAYSDPDSGDEVIAYETVEMNSPYCLFSTANNECDIWRFSRNGYRWPGPDRVPRLIDETEYIARITIVPVNGDPVTWNWRFDLSQIAVEFP